MPPIDSTPQGGEVMHETDEPTFPQPRPGARTERSDQPRADADRDKGDAPEARSHVDPVTGAGEDIAG